MIKLGRIAAELERIYGVKHGGEHGNQYVRKNESGKSSVGTLAKTQEEIAEMLGVSLSTIKCAKNISAMPPEWQELV